MVAKFGTCFQACKFFVKNGCSLIVLNILRKNGQRSAKNKFKNIIQLSLNVGGKKSKALSFFKYNSLKMHLKLWECFNFIQLSNYH